MLQSGAMRSLHPSPGRMRALRVLLRVESLTPRLRWLVQVAIGVAATAVAGLVQYLVLPRPSIAPFVFFFLAVAVTAWLAGRAAGLVAVALSALMANRLFLSPSDGLSLFGIELRTTLLFVVGAGPVAWLCGLFRKALLETHQTTLLLERQASLMESSFAAALESEERFRTLAENSPDLIARFDRDLRHLYANAAAGRATGIPPERLVGRTSAELGLPEQVVALWESVLRRAFETGERQSMQFQLDRPDGIALYESLVAPERGPDFSMHSVLVTSRDVTERARAEQALREGEARFRHLADAMPQLVWTARPDGTVDYYNRRSAEFMGVDRRADGTWSWGPMLHPDDRARTVAAWQRAVEAGEEYQIEHRVQLANGTFRWYLTRGVPVRDERGSVVRWYGTATDIHEQKRAQEALQEADRRKNEFLGVLSHELRNPLAPIQNSIYLAMHAPPGTDQERRALTIIERQVQQLTRLVDDLLDVTRISRGKVQLKREKLDLRALARQAHDDRRDLFERSGHDLVLELPSDPLFVFADPTRLAQVIGNLLQNAAKFTPPGSRTTLAVRAVDERNAEISVADTGTGIPPEILAHLFEPFVQGERTLDRSAGGLGLGLALVKGLAELHGGTVRATSGGPGTGARFVVTVPLERRREPRPGPLTALRTPAAGRRVLIIEDNQDAAETLRDALEIDGFVVAVAFDGADGLRTARDFRPDAVICDIGLPGMNGLEVARAVRADPELGSVTLIALSGYALAEDVDRARAAGFDVHLSKPPDLAALGRSLSEARAQQ
jgi:PAS domain S-box-containing protein